MPAPREWLMLVLAVYGWWSAWGWIWIWLEPTALAAWCPSVWWVWWVCGIIAAWWVLYQAWRIFGGAPTASPSVTPPTDR